MAAARRTDPLRRSEDGGRSRAADIRRVGVRRPTFAADGTIYVGASFVFPALRPDGTRKFRLPAGGEQDLAPAVAPDGTSYTGGFDNERSVRDLGSD